MNRKLVSLLMIFVLVLAVAGCTPKQTPKEMLEEATMNSLEITSAEQDMNMHFGVDLGENPDPMVEMFASMVKDVNVNFHAKSIIEDKPQIALTGSAALSGMTYNVELYMNDSEIIMKIPMMEQYIVQEIETESGESMTLTKEQSIEINKKFNDIMLAKITDEELTLEENATVSVNGEDVKVSNISLSFDDVRSKELVKDFITTMLTDESLREIMITSQKNQLAMAGIEMTDEEIVAEIDTMSTEFEAAWTEAVSYFAVDRFDMTFSIDKDKQIVATAVGLDMTVTEPESATEIKVTMDVESTSYNINAVTDLAIPEMTEENSITAEELNSGMY